MSKTVFYQSSVGRAPSLDWFQGLSREDRRSVGRDLYRLQANWPVGMPLCKSLGGGLWEIRSSLKDRRISRLLFCIKDCEVYVLHCFFKTTQKTPQADLDLARKRMKDVTK